MKLRKVGGVVWEIKKEPPMQVPVRVYASDKVMGKMQGDRTLRQAVNVASLPGVLPNVSVMPDGHEGYGFPIGGVAAFPAEGGIVSPGGIGYDINCGMRLLRTGLTEDDVRPVLGRLVKELFRSVPSGVGSRGLLKVSKDEFLEVITEGMKWAVRQGYATQDDRLHMEEKGGMPASPEGVSRKALSRGVGQLGTLGAGNHFLEIQKVEGTFNPAAKTFGLEQGNVVVMVHTGSRGFGHQIATDYIHELLSKRFGRDLTDRELVAAPLDSREGEAYLQAMRCAVNFAFTNRQIITYYVRRVFDELLGEKLELVYDVAHNIGKFEKHGGDRVFVHRKGATRAFGPGREDLPPEYRPVGQPVIIPGSMGTASYVLVGRGHAATFESTCHGAGRVMSRSAARKKFLGKEIRERLGKRGIIVEAKDKPLIAEEAPGAYKDIDEVVRVVEAAGISDTVARLVPMGVVKG
jgi:tRNA-splicing ligase RtcB (3'-phosphate/5'-hydroxy nucleic acid ligase)